MENDEEHTTTRSFDRESLNSAEIFLNRLQHSSMIHLHYITTMMVTQILIHLAYVFEPITQFTQNW